MALKKLEIVPEREGGKLQFDESNPIKALFNPERLNFSKSVGWEKQKAKGRDVPELQFSNAEPRTLTLDLFFDTYDTEAQEKKDVRKQHTDKVLHLTTVEKHGDKHRPPVCKLRWGNAGEVFQGVLEKLDQKFTMFLEDGTPVRATLSCTFKEWRTNPQDQRRQNRESTDVAKIWMVRRGDNLSNIAAEEYLNPALWRPIAIENNVDNPLDIKPGQVLMIPKLSGRGQSGK